MKAILLIEDNRDMVRLFLRLLEGFQVITLEGFHSLDPHVGMGITLPSDASKEPERSIIDIDPAKFTIALIDGNLAGDYGGPEIARSLHKKVDCVDISSGGSDMSELMYLAGVRHFHQKPDGFKSIREMIEQHPGRS